MTTEAEVLRQAKVYPRAMVDADAVRDTRALESARSLLQQYGWSSGDSLPYSATVSLVQISIAALKAENAELQSRCSKMLGALGAFERQVITVTAENAELAGALEWVLKDYATVCGHGFKPSANYKDRMEKAESILAKRSKP